MKEPLVDVRLAKIAAEFSETIFWNNCNPWPAENEETYEFEVRKIGEQVVENAIWVRAHFGELSVTVAVLPEQGDDADLGNVSSEADAAFIAKLPVYVPLLLNEIARLRAEREDS